jgi:hypothetical protein
MRRLHVVLLLAALCGCGHGGAGNATSAQTGASASVVAGINYFCDGLAQVAKNPDGRRLFASIAVGVDAAPWREYDDERNLQAKTQTIGNYVVAEFWKRDDGAVFVQTRAMSDTGDWNESVRYCFRADGSLARSEFTLNSFETDEGIRATRVRVFAADGRALQVASETRELDSGERLADAHLAQQEPIYKKASALPFSTLLQ